MHKWTTPTFLLPHHNNPPSPKLSTRNISITTVSHRLTSLTLPKHSIFYSNTFQITSRTASIINFNNHSFFQTITIITNRCSISLAKLAFLRSNKSLIICLSVMINPNFNTHMELIKFVAALTLFPRIRILTIIIPNSLNKIIMRGIKVLRLSRIKSKISRKL